jgi:tetraacyldisaccharide 4'-kinase
MDRETEHLLFKRKNILFWICLPLFYLFSLLYGLLVGGIKFAYCIKILPRYKSKLKIISVGNITVGGSGKTPLVEWLVEFLQKENKNPGIILRGYKRLNKSYSGLVTDDSSYLDIGDEAAMFKEKFNHIKICIGNNKANSARQLEGQNCQIAIIDDGFQHWRLQRDLDIVAIDASLPLAKQRSLPLGKLREPLASLKRADIFCLTKVDISQSAYLENTSLLTKINPHALRVSAVYEPAGFYNLNAEVVTDINLDRRVAVLCGIASPLYFEKMLRDKGLKVGQKFFYPDHHNYCERDLSLIKKLSLDNGIDTIITTHKDAMRLKRFIPMLGETGIFYLQVKLKIIQNEQALHNRLLSLLSR